MSSMDILNLSVYLQWAGSFFIFFLCVLYWRRFSLDLQFVGVLGGFSFFFQLFQEISAMFFNYRYNNAIGNIYLPVEAVALLSVYYVLLRRPAVRYTIIFFGLAFLSLYALTISKQITTLNANTEAIRDIMMIVCSIAYFFVLLKDLPQRNLLEYPMFWINSAVLFYFSCTFILSLSLDYLILILKDNLIGYWTFRNFLRTLFCIIICIGIWKARKLTYQIK